MQGVNLRLSLGTDQLMCQHKVLCRLLRLPLNTRLLFVTVLLPTCAAGQADRSGHGWPVPPQQADAQLHGVAWVHRTRGHTGGGTHGRWRCLLSAVLCGWHGVAA